MLDPNQWKIHHVHYGMDNHTFDELESIQHHIGASNLHETLEYLVVLGKESHYAEWGQQLQLPFSIDADRRSMRPDPVGAAAPAAGTRAKRTQRNGSA